MIVRLTTGCWYQGILRNDGDIVEMTDAVARRFLDTRQAEIVEDHEPSPIETAALRTLPARGRHDGGNKTARR